jgi:hypothetical protein
MKKHSFRTALLLGPALLLSACAVTPPQSQHDYTALRTARPRSILVLPPVNHSPDANASLSFLSTSTMPLAEGGYYVMPVALSEEAFRQNGVTVPEEAHAIALPKLREIFGADAALYLVIERYGTSYRLVDSVVEAAASAKLMDLRSGQELWSGQVSVAIGSNQGNQGLIAMLLSAAFNQILNHVSDRAWKVSRTANHRLLSTGHANGLLYGPYHPNYGTD